MIETYGPRWLRYAFLLFTIAFCLYCFLPTLHATWFIIDDHEVITRIGIANRLPFGKIVPALGTTEVKFGSQALRYRPLYFLFQFLESSLFGKDAALWYAVRIGIFCLFGATLYTVARNILGTVIGFAFTLFELSNVYWAGIFARLGSGEAYGVLGLASIGIAFCLDDHRLRSFAACALLCIGVVVCFGTKENFIPFVVLPIAILIWNRREIGLGAKALLGVAIAFSFWVAGVVAYRIGHAAHDVYMNDATVSSRGRLLANFFRVPHVEVWLVGSLAALGLWFWLRARTSSPDRRVTYLGWASIANVVLFGFYLSQYIFYAGDWPNYDSPRYLFPGILMRDFAFTLVIVAFIGTTRSDWMKIRLGYALFAPDTLLTGVLAFGLLVAASHRASENRQQAQSMVSGSTEFMKVIRDAVRDLAGHPNAALVLVAHTSADYEPVVSTSRFFRAFGGKNPVMLEVDPKMAQEAETGVGLDVGLTKDLVRFQKNGTDIIRPFSDAFVPDCYSIGLDGSKSSDCAKGIAYAPPWEG